MIWPLEWQWKFYNVNWVGPISCYIIMCTWFVWSQVHYNFMSTYTLMKKKWGITNFIVVQLSHLKKWSKTGQCFFYIICKKLRIKNLWAKKNIYSILKCGRVFCLFVVNIFFQSFSHFTDEKRPKIKFTHKNISIENIYWYSVSRSIFELIRGPMSKKIENFVCNELSSIIKDQFHGKIF